MPQYINLATICINPFLITDATRDIFPAKIVQYIACGKVTIATPLPGITTLLPGKSHGVIYASSATDMVKEVVSLLKSPEYGQQLGCAGLNYVRQEHDHKVIAHQLETKLEEAIKEKRI